jgi:hypothetical protein
LAKARKWYLKALVGYEEVFGPKHPKTRELRESLDALDVAKGGEA